MTDVALDGSEPENSSIIGRLLDEISWEGNAKKYRGGGRGIENVLTAEVFTSLDFLPRAAFLGEVIASAQGADAARAQLVAEVEKATVSALPGDVPLAGSSISVQPDVLLTSASIYTLVEAKRIRSSRFGTDQLARELTVTVQQAGHRVPLLLVVLGSPPPVRVEKIAGRVSLEDAINRSLEDADVWRQIGIEPGDLAGRIPETLAWTTWGQIREVLEVSRLRFAAAPDTLGASVTRLCAAATRAIDWHG